MPELKVKAIEGKRASMALNESGDKVIRIRFDYDVEMIYQVKTLPGRKYHPDKKEWSAPVHVSTIEALISWGFKLDGHLQEYMNKRKERTKEIKQIGIPGLKGTLRPFQNEGVAIIEARGGNVILADEMGLGKTVEALAWLQLHPELYPVVIVVPASLKLNWLKEALTWMSHPSIEVVLGNRPWKLKKKIIVINYDILEAWVDHLVELDPKVLITDECQLYKSNKAKRTKMIKKLAKNVPHILALSGTPIVNRPIEIYNAWKLTDPEGCPEYWYFLKRYCNLRHTGFGWDSSGASHLEELHEKLINTVMIRRKKEDVLKDLPDKVRSFVPIQLHNESTYRRAEANFITYIEEVKGKEAAEKASQAEMMVTMEGLKQLAVQGKLVEAIEWIDNFLDSGEKLVVFAVHHFVIDALMAKFSYIDKTHKLADRVVKVDGSVSMTERQRAVDTFQNNPNCRLFVGNIKAAGVGITLTASSNVVFLELPWTPGDVTQAEDRCHRIGQKESVNIYYLLATGTIEEEIAQLLDKKRKILDAVTDGIETNQETLLKELIRIYKLKPRKK